MDIHHHWRSVQNSPDEAEDGGSVGDVAAVHTVPVAITVRNFDEKLARNGWELASEQSVSPMVIFWSPNTTAVPSVRAFVAVSWPVVNDRQWSYYKRSFGRDLSPIDS